MNVKLIVILIVILSSSVIFSMLSFVVLTTNSSEVEILEEYQISIPSDKTISIGTISNDPSKIIQRTQPVVDYIASKHSDEKTQYKGKVIVTKTIADMDEMLINQRIDLYFDSPLIACLESEKTEAVPFLIRWKEGVEKYHSVFFVKEDSTIDRIDERLIGKTIAFEAPESTSGYLIPKAYLVEKGLRISENDNAKSIRSVFSFSDTTTAHWVFSGIIDIGVMSNMDFDSLSDLQKNELKIIERSFDMPRQLVLHRSDMNSDEVGKIKQILLQMHQDRSGIDSLKNFKNTEKFTDLTEKEDFCYNLFERIGKTMDD